MFPYALPCQVQTSEFNIAVLEVTKQGFLRFNMSIMTITQHLKKKKKNPRSNQIFELWSFASNWPRLFGSESKVVKCVSTSENPDNDQCGPVKPQQSHATFPSASV